MKRDLGWLWHGLGGFGIDGISLVGAAGWHAWLAGPQPPPWLGFPIALALGVVGYLRERHQHPSGRMTPHRWAEALAWGTGGLISATMALFIL